MPSDKIRKLTEYLKEAAPKNYAIKNAILEGEADYIKNGYFKMLAVALQQGDTVTEAQRGLYARLLYGAAADYAMEDYFRDALEIEISEYVEFSEYCRKSPLKYRFALDAMLLVCCDSHTEEQLELVAAFMESLRLKKKEVEYLSKLCQAILRQDSDSYWKLEADVIPGLLPRQIVPYTEYFLEDFVFCDDASLRVINSDKKEVDLKPFQEEGILAKSFVTLKHIVFDLSSATLKFQWNTEVVFEDCEFINGTNPIRFKEVGKVSFLSCSFQGFKSRVILERDVRRVDLIRCSFENCYSYSECYKNYNAAMSGLIACDICRSSDEKRCMNFVDESKFFHCGAINKVCTAYVTEGLLINGRASVRNSEFKDCWAYGYTDVPTKEKICQDSDTTLFPKGTVNFSNTMENTVEFAK